MALIALLSARDGARGRPVAGVAAPLIDFGGQPLVEYQARQALAAGADKVLIMIDLPAPDLAQLVDRLSAEQERPPTSAERQRTTAPEPPRTIALIRDMTMLSREIALD